MIDHVSCVVKLKIHAIKSGYIVFYDHLGDIEKELRQKAFIESPFTGNKCLVLPFGTQELYIRGNPSTWFQDHNLFGVNSVDIIKDFILSVCETVKPTGLTPMEKIRIDLGIYRLTRLDITEYLTVGTTQKDTSEFINYLQSYCRSRAGRSILTGDSVYFGKHSRRWTFKFYDKLKEMETKKEFNIPNKAVIDEYLKGKCRAELTLRSPELKNITLENGCNWSNELIINTYSNYIGKLTMPTQIETTTSDYEDLPPRMIGIIESWKKGTSIKDILPKATFYRYRRDIINDTGIDISTPSPSINNCRTLVKKIDVTRAEEPPKSITENPKLYYLPKAV